MGKKSRKSIVIGLSIVFVVTLILLGVTYAYYRTRIIDNPNNESISVTSKKLEIVYRDGSATLSMEGLIEPGFTATKQFSVENTGDDEISFGIKLDNVTNTFIRQSDWTYTLSGGNLSEPITGIVPSVDTYLINTMSIPANTTYTYTLTVIYENSIEDQSVDMGANLAFRVNIDEITSFEVKNIYNDSLYFLGLQAQNEPVRAYMADTSNSNVRSIVQPLEKGKAYEMQFPNETQRLVIFVMDSDPRELGIGEALNASTVIKEVWTAPTETDRKPLLYIPQKDGEYLVIYTGWKENTPIYLGEHTITTEEDAAGPWYYAPLVADLYGNDNSYGNYNWTSEEVIDNLYEPMRTNNPDYITRKNIGKDQSGLYDMYSYVFEPDNYEQTVFLTAGIHGNEQEGYFALANFMEQVVNEDGTNKQLLYLKENVRFVIIPIINVWATHKTASTGPDIELRGNSTNTDLNRDYSEQTQQENKNVISIIEQYKDSLTFAIDFHTTPANSEYDLFYNFQIKANNASVNLKTTNHMYHTLLNKGYIDGTKKILVPSDSQYGNIAAIDGLYSSSRTLQAFIWNNYRIPSLTVEHLNNDKWPEKFSSKSLTLAVETYGNFIIQNALHYKK